MEDCLQTAAVKPAETQNRYCYSTTSTRADFVDFKTRGCNIAISLAPQNIGIPEGTPKNIADGYLKFGESIFDYACAMSYGSSYFEREGKTTTRP